MVTKHFCVLDTKYELTDLSVMMIATASAFEPDCNVIAFCKAGCGQGVYLELQHSLLGATAFICQMCMRSVTPKRPSTTAHNFRQPQ
eukprot:1792327-Amphidinium_carterae.1